MYLFKDRPIDLSSLIYDQISPFSKISYMVLLISSISSVCIDLAKILKWGKKPIITSYFTFTFLNVFLFILTKFLVQSYILSMSIKSLMYHWAIVTDATYAGEMYLDLLNHHYRSLLEGPELLTFNQATLYAPTIILVLVFLPPTVSVLLFSLKYNGLKNWSNNFVQHTVLMLFAIISNMSYFGRRPLISNSKFLRR